MVVGGLDVGHHLRIGDGRQVDHQDQPDEEGAEAVGCASAERSVLLSTQLKEGCHSLGLDAGHLENAQEFYAC
jgi:hypothetical protein